MRAWRLLGIMINMLDKKEKMKNHVVDLISLVYVLSGEEAWEEYGCILWDLSASKTNAELMVLKVPLQLTINLDVAFHLF
jgi:hypothetical protein